MHAVWNTADILCLQDVYSNGTQTRSFIIYSRFPTPYDILSCVEKKWCFLYEKDSNFIIH